MPAKTIVEQLVWKRDGKQLSAEDIDAFVQQLVDGNVEQSQIGAWLMACHLKGLNMSEAAALTEAMARSGSTVQWPSKGCDRSVIVDKHSTGGVGDKISIILAPLLAACGLIVRTRFLCIFKWIFTCHVAVMHGYVRLIYKPSF